MDYIRLLQVVKSAFYDLCVAEFFTPPDLAQMDHRDVALEIDLEEEDKFGTVSNLTTFLLSC